MLTAQTSILRAKLATLPKVDLHRHLEGSVRPQTLAELASRYGVDLPPEIVLHPTADARSAASDDRIVDLHAMCEIVGNLLRSEEDLGRVVHEVYEDAAGDNLRYVELTFSPLAMASMSESGLDEIIDAILQRSSKVEEAVSTQAGWIIRIEPTDPPKVQEELIRFAQNGVGRGIVGLELQGELDRACLSYLSDLLSPAVEAGLGIVVHEVLGDDPGLMRLAIERLGVRRFGGGASVIEDQETIEIAADRRVTFMTCLSADRWRGLVEDLSEHPLPRMLKAGLWATVTTEAPRLLETSLTDEYTRMVSSMDLSVQTVKAMILTAVQASFLPLKDKQALELELVAGLLEPD